MTGIGKSFSSVPLTNANIIDGMLFGEKWDGQITYAFPTSTAQYGSNYPQPPGNVNGRPLPNDLSTFTPLNSTMQTAVRFGLEGTSAANRSFSVEGFTLANIAETATPSTANIRLATTALNGFDGIGGYAYQPGGSARSGDVWFNDSNVSAAAGNKAWYNALHETGHALGLKHPFETDSNGTQPVLSAQYDAMEYTVMSYNAYPNDPAPFGNEVWGYAQSYMMLDIRALQQMYGADFTANSTDTVYKWNPNSGNTLVNGVAAITPGANVIFATIWDGGGVDTYDLSSYTEALRLDLRPGGSSAFAQTQRAVLDPSTGLLATGSIYNALQFNADARSLIENATGGSGSDNIRGNEAANQLLGNNGNDVIFGQGGNDRLFGGAGIDQLFGEAGVDIFSSGGGNDTLTGGLGNDYFAFNGTTNTDTVTDFNSGDAEDVVDFRGNVYITSYADLRTNHIQQVAGTADVRIFDGLGNVMVLRNVSLSALNEADFLFG